MFLVIKIFVFGVVFGEKVAFGKVGFEGSKRLWRILCENIRYSVKFQQNWMDVRASSHGHVTVCKPLTSASLLDM